MAEEQGPSNAEENVEPTLGNNEQKKIEPASPPSFSSSPWHDPALSSDSALSSIPVEEERTEPPPASKSDYSPFWSRNGLDFEQPPLRLRELLAVFAAIVLCDLTIYRGEGFAGCALLFAAMPLLLAAGSPRAKWSVGLWVVGGMELLLAAKLLWQGSPLLVVAGFVLLVAFSMMLAGMRPFVPDVFLFTSQTVPAGYAGLVYYKRAGSKYNLRLDRGPGLSFALPAVALLAFGALFLMANPDLRSAFGEGVERFFSTLKNWFVDLAPRISEVLFWIAALWISVGLLRPLFRQNSESGPEEKNPPEKDSSSPTERSEKADSLAAPLYGALRNTLIAVIVLFFVYLVFEFKTLWFRVFHEGFYYSGYAHEGAAWLTTVLALSTAVLSLIFKGSVLMDSRLPFLRRLAWIWTVQNLILALSVYNRLGIYIGFNGLSHMRMVAFFGISVVLAGFVLVVWKIVHDRSFVWLVQRQLWALALTGYLFGLTPVDIIVTNYNVRRILAGDPAPSVQISVHPIGPEGVPILRALLDCEDEIIRDGVRAMLAKRYERDKIQADLRLLRGWTATQFAERRMLRLLDESRGKWEEYSGTSLEISNRDAALKRFQEYADRWF